MRSALDRSRYFAPFCVVGAVWPAPKLQHNHSPTEAKAGSMLAQFCSLGHQLVIVNALRERAGP